MDDRDMGDRRVVGQRLGDARRIDRLVLGPLEHDGGALVVFADLRDALAVGAVDQHQQLAVGGTKVPIMASTAKVPLPCIGTQVKAALAADHGRPGGRASGC